MYHYCLKRVNLDEQLPSAVQSQQTPLGILTESEWIFVFERAGALGKKCAAFSNTLDLRYTINMLKITMHCCNTVATPGDTLLYLRQC
jgi:hypothetical protein